jgi:hypothetical protein
MFGTLYAYTNSMFTTKNIKENQMDWKDFFIFDADFRFNPWNPELIHIWDTDLSDMYKEANNVRPRHYKTWWTKAELEAEYDYLHKTAMVNAKYEAEAENKALIRFEKLIQDTIDLGAGDWETAIRWLVQGEGLEMNAHDLQYFFWGHGLSYEIQNEWAKKYEDK